MTLRPGLNFAIYAELDGNARSASAARALIRHVLGDSHPAANDAALVISELVTNAITHSRSGLPGATLSVAIETAEPDTIVLEVRDLGGQPPPRETVAPAHAEHSRGLAIVSALAADWGSHMNRTGRVTWCHLTKDRRVASHADELNALLDPGLTRPAAGPTPRPRQADRDGPLPDHETPDREAG